MKLFSYIIARDFGFAPNPFFGSCSLATCKPKIRKYASIGDWVIATGAKKKYKISGHLICAMQINEVMDFDTYWNDPRFLRKRPVMNGSLMQIYGDNIYHKQHGTWIQENSHHSKKDGQQNQANVEHDTSVDRILISNKFIYFGSNAPVIPKRFRTRKVMGQDICCYGSGNKVFDEKQAKKFIQWVQELNQWGLQGLPLEFRNHKRADSTTQVESKRGRRK